MVSSFRCDCSRSGVGPAAFVVLGALAWLASIYQSSANAEGPGPGADEPAGSLWRLVPIPETWKEPPRVRPAEGPGSGRDGYAWYRCEVAVPASWEGRTLELFVEPVDDARAAYINGVQVGSAGTFPPRYRTGLGESGRYRIPDGLVRAGETNVIAVRAYYNDGRSNFAVAAPSLFDEEHGEAIRMEGPWAYRSGDDATWADGPVEIAEAHFDQVDPFENLDTYLHLRQGDIPALSPTEALERFVVADDLAVDLVLSEPEIAQPLQVTFDERGRLWLVEYRQYPEPAGLKAVSRDKFLRSVYDRVPEPPPHGAPGKDRISIHEDRDGDGTFESHKVFVEGLNLATSVARGRGGVWVLNPPYLLFYPDRDGDDRPDGDPEVHLDGFGLEDSHSICNSLRWGPDGWLYAAQGSTVTGHVRRPGEPETSIVHSMGQLIWRYHPETHRYEVFAEGGGNTFGVEIDALGRVYSGHNGGDTRGFHYVQGGYYQKGFTKHGALSNPYAFGYFPAMAHHSVPRFTHTFLLNEGGALPVAYRGMLFGVEPLQGQVVISEVTPNGTTFQTHDVARPLTTDDPWFRPVEIKLGPDGAIYLADFYEQRIDHSSHYAGRIDRSNGRVYRIRNREASPGQYPGDLPPKAPFNLAAMSGTQLLTILDHPNRWFRQEALRLLGDRKDASLIPFLHDQLSGPGSTSHPLESLWALNLSGGLDKETGIGLLKHTEPAVRAWTVRLLCDDRKVSPACAAALADLSAKESYASVRSQLACSARRLPAADALPILKNLLGHEEDAADPHIPLLLWWGLEAKASEAPDQVLALFDNEALWDEPIVRQTILERLMRRFARSGGRSDLIACARLLENAPTREHAKLLMAGFEAALEGRSLSGLPDRLVQAIAVSGEGSLVLRVRQKEEPAITEALQAISNPATAPPERIELMRALSETGEGRAIEPLLGIARQDGPEPVRVAALAALRPFDGPEIADAVLAMHASLPGNVRDAAQDVLVSRREWARRFFESIESGQIDRTLVPDAIARKALLLGDDRLTRLVHDLWGPLEGATSGAMLEEIERLSEVIASGSGNPYNGKALYLQSCGKCHVLYGEGGDIGPDLTSYQRGDLRLILLSVVNPSAEVREGFETHLALMADGRIATGFLADQDDRVMILRDADGNNQILPRPEIEEVRQVPQSVMPTGLLEGLDDQQVRDLFAYLRSTQPLNN